jgi:hypothetical protein
MWRPFASPISPAERVVPACAWTTAVVWTRAGEAQALGRAGGAPVGQPMVSPAVRTGQHASAQKIPNRTYRVECPRESPSLQGDQPELNHPPLSGAI